VISVNLLPTEERTEDRQVISVPRKKFVLPLAAVLAVLVPLGALYMIQQIKIQNLKSDIMIAEQETARLKPQINKINQLIQKREELNLRLNLIRDLNRARTAPVKLLDELSLQVPEYLWLTKVGMAGSAVQVEGITFSNLVIADLMSRLERTDLYSEIDLTKAERRLLGSEKVIHFIITANGK